MSEQSYWIVGRYLDPRPEDRETRFTQELQAIDVASKLSERLENELVGVWDEHDRVEWLFINGEQFCPV